MDTRFWMELTKKPPPKDPQPRPELLTLQRKFLSLDRERYNRLPMMFDVDYIIEHEGITKSGASQWVQKMLKREAILAKPKDTAPANTKLLPQLNFFKKTKEL